MSVTASINDYSIKVFYDGSRRSPLDPKNYNCNVVTVKNNKTGTTQHLVLWRPRVTDESGVLFVFYCLLQSCMLGALDPAACAVFLGVEDPETNEDFRVLFHNHRTTAARLSPIINDRDELIKTMRMLEQHLGLKKNKHE